MLLPPPSAKQGAVGRVRHNRAARHNWPRWRSAMVAHDVERDGVARRAPLSGAPFIDSCGTKCPDSAGYGTSRGLRPRLRAGPVRHLDQSRLAGSTLSRRHSDLQVRLPFSVRSPASFAAKTAKGERRQPTARVAAVPDGGRPAQHVDTNRLKSIGAIPRRVFVPRGFQIRIVANQLVGACARWRPFDSAPRRGGSGRV
jgi:hypothetical protein